MASITYSSTRGGQKNLDFRTVVMTGLAHDRGLFVPDSFPTVEKEELESWRGLSYSDLAVKVISKFVKEDQVPLEKLTDIVKRSCAAFNHDDVTPVLNVGGHHVLVSVHLQCTNFVFFISFLMSFLADDRDNRSFSMAQPLLSRMLPCKCLETFSNTFWRLDPMEGASLFWEQHRETLDLLLFTDSVERRESTASFFSRRDEFRQFKRDK